MATNSSPTGRAKTKLTADSRPPCLLVIGAVTYPVTRGPTRSWVLLRTYPPRRFPDPGPGQNRGSVLC
jgi:hypothetical protein